MQSTTGNVMNLRIKIQMFSYASYDMPLMHTNAHTYRSGFSVLTASFQLGSFIALNKLHNYTIHYIHY